LTVLATERHDTLTLWSAARRAAAAVVAAFGACPDGAGDRRPWFSRGSALTERATEHVTL